MGSAIVLCVECTNQHYVVAIRLPWSFSHILKGKQAPASMLLAGGRPCHRGIIGQSRAFCSDVPLASLVTLCRM